MEQYENIKIKVIKDKYLYYKRFLLENIINIEITTTECIKKQIKSTLRIRQKSEQLDKNNIIRYYFR